MKKKLINNVSATLYKLDGYEVDKETDLSDSNHPQEIKMYMQSVTIINSINDSLKEHIDARIKDLDSKRLKETIDTEMCFISGQIIELKNLKKLITGEN